MIYSTDFGFIDHILEDSDEEVLGFNEDETDDETELDSDEEDLEQDIASEKAGQSEDESIQDWGRSKADYYDADVIETEADALEEEQEARRLQNKQLESLTEADFGLDEVQWKQEISQDTETQRETITERLPELQIDENASPEERVRLLKSRYPEFELLAKEFLDLKRQHDDLIEDDVATAPEVMQQTNSELSARTAYRTLQLRSLASYLASIAIYLALLTSTASSAAGGLALAPSEMREHPVMQRLLRSRQRWERFCELQEPESEPDISTREKEDSHVELSSSLKQKTKSATNGAKKSELSKSERKAIKARKQAEKEIDLKIQETEEQLAALDKLIKSKPKQQPKRQTFKTPIANGDDSDIGDEDALTAQEAADKAQRKKSLRFYTSQMAQKSSKREAAAREAGGDMDLPYKEPPKPRERRQDKHELKELSVSDEEPMGPSPPPSRPTSKRKLSSLPASADPEAYYDAIHTRTQKKKASRATSSTNPSTDLTDPSNPPIDGPPADGKRPLPYAIATNKGLAPKRRKEVRNPRVKKKLRYEQKMKKLGSVRQVWKGGEGRGGYGGEGTGINVGVVKGRKL